MMFSKACEYAIRAAIYLSARPEGTRASLGDIAEQIDSPVAFTSKILQQLVHSGVVRSVKGATGGFEVTQATARATSLLTIVQAIDGDGVTTDCVLGLHRCSSRKPCPAHHRFAAVRDELHRMLETTTLSDLAAGYDRGESHLRILTNKQRHASH